MPSVVTLLSGMMNEDTALRRIVGAAILLTFAAVLIAPVYAAMATCTMPCCNHASAAPIAKTPIPCGNCNVTAAADNDTATVAVPPTHAPIVAPTNVVVVELSAPASSHAVAPICDHPRSLDRPLHLVHSVFLI